MSKARPFMPAIAPMALFISYAPSPKGVSENAGLWIRGKVISAPNYIDQSCLLSQIGSSSI